MESQLLVFIVLIAVMWLLMIRPQQRRVKQHQQLVRSLEVGDEVVTIGGIYGRITSMDDESIWLDLGRDNLVRFSRQAISRRTSPEPEEVTGEEPEVDAG